MKKILSIPIPIPTPICSSLRVGVAIEVDSAFFLTDEISSEHRTDEIRNQRDFTSQNVTMTEEGPVAATLLLDGILDDDPVPEKEDICQRD